MVTLKGFHVRNRNPLWDTHQLLRSKHRTQDYIVLKIGLEQCSNVFLDEVKFDRYLSDFQTKPSIGMITISRVFFCYSFDFSYEICTRARDPFHKIEKCFWVLFKWIFIYWGYCRCLMALGQFPIDQRCTRGWSSSFPVCLFRSWRNCSCNHCAGCKFKIKVFSPLSWRCLNQRERTYSSIQMNKSINSHRVYDHLSDRIDPSVAARLDNDRFGLDSWPLWW